MERLEDKIMGNIIVNSKSFIEQAKRGWLALQGIKKKVHPNWRKEIYNPKFLKINNLYWILKEQNVLEDFIKLVGKETGWDYAESTVQQYLYPRCDRKYNAPILRKLALRFLKEKDNHMKEIESIFVWP